MPWGWPSHWSSQISTERAARAGVLIKNRIALERMRSVDVVLFDKTGTLTQCQHLVTGAVTLNGLSDTELLDLAAAVEADSEHPVARAIVNAANGSAKHAHHFRSLPGRGVEAVVDGEPVAVGGPALLEELGADVPAVLASRTRGWVERGASVLHVIKGDKVIGAIALEDAPREQSRQAIDALHADGVAVAPTSRSSPQALCWPPTTPEPFCQ